MTTRSTILTCALTGAGDTTGKNPAVPVTAKEIATSGIEAAQAGAAIIHVHVREPKTRLGSMNVDYYREVVERVRDSGVDVVINLTTGPGARFVPGDEDPKIAAPGSTITTPERRVEHIMALRPEICSLDMGSMNFGPHVFANIPAHLSTMAASIRDAGVKPELEVFEAGHIQLAVKMVADGVFEAPCLFQIVLGVPWGAPATPEAMIFMRDQLPPGANWAGFGIGRAQFPFVALAAMLGGHCRVGLEDNLYLEKGVLAPSNAALVEKAVRILQLTGATVATPAEAREILGLRASAARSL
ncbi:MAG: 3-keto-5-aminohexanoate cleavage protein [Vicinamibacterales bacterium]|jgi:uncharacterized protein (DUF849 family)|nr:3-keto-5-aminohexanoate cleavage protein [Vicinamibacterales bacterium]